MGEDAMYQGQRIKIGTCEDLYYLRADQAFKVTGLAGNTDPQNPTDARESRFRFPFPDEDEVEPGMFDPYNRGLEVKVTWPESTELSCAKDCGDRSLVSIEQQRPVGDALVLVVRCVSCDERYRLSTVVDVIPVVRACAEMEGPRAAFFAEVGNRIVRGYVNPNPWVGKVATPHVTTASTPKGYTPYNGPTYEKTYGSKYEATKNLSVVEIAKLVRLELKIAVEKGELPLWKYGARSDHNSIDVWVKPPPGFQVRTQDPDGTGMSFFSPQAKQVEEKVKAITDSYNYDGSDIQSDYFNVRFYSHLRWEKS